MSLKDDDSPTVVLDLIALKKQQLLQEEELANIAQELEFAVGPIEGHTKPAPKAQPAPIEIAAPVAEATDSELFAEKFLIERANNPSAETNPGVVKSKLTKIILFDFQSDFFDKAKSQFPSGYDYHFAKTLEDLNKFLKSRTFQIVVFNYEVNPKAVNQLIIQIKRKLPLTKTMIIAKSISPDKAKLHAQTAAGANGYYQLPLDAKKIEGEFQKIKSK
jgi:hypothetical protein